MTEGFNATAREGEILELRAENERLRAENESLGWHLETILQACDKPSCGWYSVFETTIDEARASLNIQQPSETA